MQTGVQTRARCNSFGPPLTDPTSRMITRWKPKQSNMVLKINLQRDGKMHKAWGMQGSAEVKHAQGAPVWRAALAAARLKQRVSLLVMVGNAVINNGLLLSLRDGLLLLVMLQIPQPVKMLRDREHAKST